MDKNIRIAIDGPASAGKSTIAKLVAKKLNYIYIDTGAMYRAVTFACLEKNIDLDDEQAVIQALPDCQLEFGTKGDNQLLYLNGRDVTEAIRSHQVTQSVSQVAAYQGVRQELVDRQRILGQAGGVVMDGRDIGTTVFPNAEIKIFLVASVEERAMRRYQENCAKGMQVDLDQLQQEIEIRDYKDANRAISPLTQAADAVLIDTTGLSIEAVVQQVLSIVKKK